ncbi:hypothetical protein Nepgr_017999 [Nepenthes gracilis]|uniref:Uncharacterized protein n=1 Tax=Nepenthes gracilis TaxID=150966 RepID=A0AAD3SQH0_NEPGR|nr:hypothetical protein Nepgr_017999 [Nepenthes gracilis]
MSPVSFFEDVLHLVCSRLVVMWRCVVVACCLSFLVCGVLRAVEWCISVLWDSMAGLLTSRFVAVGVCGHCRFCDAPFHSKYFKLPLHLFMEALQAMLIFYTRSCLFEDDAGWQLLFLDAGCCALAWACEWRGGLAVDGSSGSLRVGWQLDPFVAVDSLPENQAHLPSQLGLASVSPSSLLHNQAHLPTQLGLAGIPASPDHPATEQSLNPVDDDDLERSQLTVGAGMKMLELGSLTGLLADNDRSSSEHRAASEVDGAVKPSFDAVPYSVVDGCGWISMSPLLRRSLTHFALAMSCGGVKECCLQGGCS